MLLLEADETDAARFAETAAGAEGAMVRIATDLDGALDALDAEAFDVIVAEPASLDHPALLDQLRRVAPTTPTLVLTSDRSEALAQAALERGAVEVLPKTDACYEDLATRLAQVVETWSRVDPRVRLAQPPGSIDLPELSEPFPRDRAPQLSRRIKAFMERNPVDGVLICERAGRILVNTMPDHVDTRRLGQKAALLPHYSRTTGQTMGLTPDAHALFLVADDGFVTLSSAPGQLTMALLLPANTGMPDILGMLHEASQAITSAGAH